MTAQAREIIYINGRKEQMAAEPLTPFLLTNPKIPFTAPNTACWRGYIGTWELTKDKLYLKKFSGYIETPEDKYGSIDLSYLFPGQKKVFADWFTGIIKIEQGKLLEYVHMGYASVYEKDFFLVFEDGIKVDEYLIDNRTKK